MFLKLIRSLINTRFRTSLLLGNVFGLPIVLSFSGHFLLFWMHTNILKYLALLIVAAFIGFVVGLIIDKLKKLALEFNKVHITTLILFLVFFASLGLGFRSNIPLPLLPAVPYDVTLKLTERDKHSIPISEIIVGVRMSSVDPSRYSEIACDSELRETQKNTYYFRMKPDGILRCSFSGNPRDAVIFTFSQPQDDEWDAEVIVYSGIGRETKMIYNIVYPEKLSRKYGVLLPHTYLSLFCLMVDIISFIIISALLACSLLLVYYQARPEKIKIFLARAFVLPSVLMMIYLVFYPYFSGYIIGKDRTDFQLYRLPEFERMIRDVNRYVPADASMMVIYPGKYPVSPLFGYNYTRRLLPQYPAPESVSADFLDGLEAEYLLISAELFEYEKLGEDGQLHFVIYGGGEVMYPVYSLNDFTNSGLEIIASCVREPDCQVRYYIFRVKK